MSDDRGIGLKGWLTGQKSKIPRAETKTEAITLEKYRIAVLPLANITSNSSDEYFADGMTEELIATLANVSGLQVISRTSIMQYKNTHKKIVDIGKELGAGTIIEGSVRKAGNQLRISVQLIDAQEDRHLWAQTYDRELKDIFAVQSDIARNVSDALRVQLLPRESAHLKEKFTPSIEAYTLYLKGRHEWNKRTRDANEKALEYLRSAISRAPSYALAYAGLADCYNVAADWGFMPARDAYPQAKKAALKALEIDYSLGEAHASLALTLQSEWNWAAAEAEFRRAIELNPNYASARQWYSELLSALGRRQEALIEAEKACEMDPLSPIIISHMSDALFEVEEYELAVEQCKKVLDIQPDFASAHVNLACSYAKMSMCQEAFTECQKLESLRNSDTLSKITSAYTYALCGREDESRRILLDAQKKLDGENIFLIGAAETYTLLGDKDRAIELLVRGYESHNAALIVINGISFENLRSDPRFIDLQKKMGLTK